MKNLILPLFAALLFAACQNAAPAPGQAPEQVEQQAEPSKPVTQVDVLQTIAKSKTMLQDVNGFLADLKALPETTKTTNKDLYETLQKFATEVAEKEPANLSSLESVAAQGNDISDQEGVRKMIQATEEYARHMDGFRSRLQTLKNGGEGK